MERIPLLRTTLLLANLTAAIALPLLFLQPTQFADHASGVYRGWRSNKLNSTKQPLGIDTRVNAGQFFVPCFETSGRWASLSVGNRASQPDLPRYCQSAEFLNYLVPLLIAMASALMPHSKTHISILVAAAAWHCKSNIELVDSGDVELSLIGPVFGLYLAGLYRMHLRPGLLGWITVVLSTLAGWNLFPIEWIAIFVPSTAAWLCIAFEHPLKWHLALFLGIIIGAMPWVWSVSSVGASGQMLSEVFSAELRRVWLVCGESTTKVLSLLAIQVVIVAAPLIDDRLLRRLAVVLATAAFTFAGVALSRPELFPAHLAWDSILVRPALPLRAPAPAIDLSQQIRPTARVLCEASENDTIEASLAYWILLHSKAPLLIGVRGEGESVPWIFCNGRLGGRVLSDWTDDELDRFIARWNIGWIVVQDAQTVARFSRCKSMAKLSNGDAATLPQVFAINRKHQYLLRGAGHCSVREDGSTVLSDLHPEGGSIILSMRFQPLWTLGDARITPEIDPYDPWPILCIPMSSPKERAVLRCLSQ